MPDSRKYATASALMAAVTARAKSAAPTSGRSTEQLIRQFEFSRLIARVFASQSAHQWVLKGGLAALVRVPAGRMTRDIDLLHHAENDDLDKAVQDFEEAMAIDLGDHFTFRVAEVEPIQAKTGQTGVAGRGISVAVESGKARPNIPIDIVADSVLTQRPEIGTIGSVTIPGIDAPQVRLYPLVDHLADKIAATQARFASGRRSTRVRDMADLALFSLSQTVDGAALHTAIAAEWAHRDLPGEPLFDPPEEWRLGYTTTVRDISGLSGYADFDTARALLASFLDPVFVGEASISTWNPSTLTWEPTARHREGDTA